MVSEAELSAFARKAFKNSGMVFWRVSNGPVKHGGIMKKSEIAGFPDWAGVSPWGFFWALELKTATGKLSDEQRGWLKSLGDSGAIVGVARSFDDIVEFIKLCKEVKK